MSHLLKVQIISIISLIFLTATSVFSSPSKLSFQARIIKPNGKPLIASGVSFRFTVTDHLGTCVIYQEDHNSVNMADSNGNVTISVGAGTQSYPSTALTLTEVFDNNNTGYNCKSGGTYFSGTTDSRKLAVQFNDGSGWQTISGMDVNSVPFAMQSTSALKLGAYDASEYLRTSTLPNCGGGQALHYNGGSFTCVTASGGGGGSGTVTQVTSTNPFVSVATSTTTPVITIARASGTQDGFLASSDYSSFNSKLGTTTVHSGDVTGTYNNLVLNNVVTAGTSAKVTFDAKGRIISSSSLNSSDITTALGYTPASAAGTGSVTQVSSTNPFVSVATSTTTPVITITQASSTQDGFLSSSDWSTFNSKQDALGFTPANVASAVLITTNHSGDVTGTYNNLILNNTGVTSGTYTKVSVDAKGRVTASSSLNSSDITTALGFTPVSSTNVGTVTQVSSTNPFVSVATSTTTPVITIAQASSTQDGFLSSADWSIFNSKQDALGFTPANVASAVLITTAHSGDVTGTYNNLVLNNVVSSGTATKVTFDTKGRIISSSSLNSADITTALGFTPVNVTSSVVNGGQNGVVTIGTTDGSNISLIASGSTRVTVLASGDVGIGTVSPSQKLDVAGNINANGMFVGTDGNGGLISGGGAGNIAVKDGAGHWALYKSSGGSLHLQGTSAAAGKLVVLASGDVGIGTAAPTAPLEVRGNQNIFTTNGISNVRIGINPGGGGTPSVLFDNAVDTFNIDNLNGTGLRFVHNASTVPMVIAASGSVGIGTTTPERKLHVAGAIRVEANSLPSSPESGDIAIDSSDSNKLKWYDGSSWQNAGGTVGSSGTVTLVSSTNPFVSIAASTTTPVITIAQASSTQDGFLSSGDYTIFYNKIGISTGFSGDVTGTYNSLVLNNVVSSGTATKVTFDSKGRIISSSSLNSADITTALGFTPVNVTSSVLNGGQTGNVSVGSTNSNSVSLLTNNTAQLTVLSSGDVAIGTSISNGYKLNVNGPVFFNTGILDLGGFNHRISYTDGHLTLTNGSTGHIALQTGGGTKVTLTNAGNLGIGVTTPERSIHTSGAIRVEANSLPSSPESGDIAIDSSDSNKLKWYNGSSWQSAGTSSLAQASGTQDGFLSSSDWSIFSAKLGTSTSFSGDVTGAYNNLVLNDVVTSGTATKVTFDTKGRIISSTNLSSTDISTALNFTPTSSGQLANYLPLTGGSLSGSLAVSTSATPAGGVATFNGNVGIGTSAIDSLVHIRSTVGNGFTVKAGGASATFDVNDSGSHLPFFRARGGYGGGNVLVKAQVYQGNQEAYFSVSGNGGETLYAQASTGRVGIATSAPERALHVAGPMRLDVGSLPSSPKSGDIAIDSSDSNKFKWYDGSSWQSAGGTVGSSGTVTGVSSTNPFVSVATSTTTPVITIARASSTQDGFLASTDWTIFNNKQDALGFTPLNVASAVLNGGQLGNVNIGTNNSNAMSLITSNTTRITILSSGDVGIGTASPSSKLEVSGTMRVGITGSDSLSVKVFPVASDGGEGLRISANNTSHYTSLYSTGGGPAKTLEGFYDSNSVLALSYNPGAGAPHGTYFSYGARGVISNSTYPARLRFQPRGTTIDSLVLNYDGSVGVGIVSATAKLHLASGTSTASGAALKLTSGSLLGSPEEGAIEFDGTNLYYTDSSSSRKTISTGSSGFGSGNSGFVGSLKYPTTANCVWSLTNTSFSNFASDSDCGTPAVEGAALAPDTSKTPAIKFASLPAGRYMIVANGLMYGYGGTCAFQFYDGTNSFGLINVVDTLGDRQTYMTGFVNYTTAQTNLNINIQAVKVTGTECQLYSNVAPHASSLKIDVIRIDGQGSAVELADANADTKVMVEKNSNENFIRFNTSGTERVTISPTGYLGIATSAPERLLHVAGPIRIAAGSLPGSPASGDIAIDSSDSNKLKWYNGSSWQSAGGSAFSGVTDIINSSGNINLSPTSGGGSVNITSTTASTSPSTGALIVSGGIGVAGALNVAGAIATSSAVSATGLDINKTNTSSVSSPSILSTGLTVAPTASNTLDVWGVNSLINYNSAFDGNRIISAHFTAQRYGAGNLQSAIGVVGAADNHASGTVTAALGLYGRSANYSSGTISDAKGIYSTVVNTGGGSIGTGYGVFIDTIAGSTNYGLYQSNATNKNYMAGGLGIGIASATAKLDVQGGPARFGKTMQNVITVGPLNTSPAYYYINTKIPFDNSAGANQIHITGYLHGNASNKLLKITLGWYVWSGTWNWYQYKSELGNYNPTRIRLGTYDDSGTTRIRIEIANDSIYWSTYYISANDVIAPGNYYENWSYSEGALPGDTGNIVTVSQASSGNIGIGAEASATDKLAISGHLKLLNGTDKIYLNRGTGAFHQIGGDNADNFLEIIAAGGGGVKLGSGSGGTALTAQSNGKIAVGLATANAKLDVMGTDTVGIKYEKTGFRDARISVADPTKTWSFSTGWAASGDFSLIEEGVAGDVIYFKQGGNVGISTTNPSRKLEVSGEIGTSGQDMIYSRYTTGGDSYAGSFGWNSLQLGNNGTNYIIAGHNAAGGALSFIVNNTTRYDYGVTAPNGTEAMTILSNGNVGIGISPPSNKLHVGGNIGATGWIGAGCETNCEVSGGYVILNTDGTISQSSDKRLKENIHSLDYGLNDLLKLEPVKYNFINQDRTHLGFIAQDVQKIIPEVVDNGKESKFLGIQYTQLISLLTKAIQDFYKEFTEQKVKINRTIAAQDEQEQKIINLENQVKLLKDENTDMRKRLEIIEKSLMLSPNK